MKRKYLTSILILFLLMVLGIYGVYFSSNTGYRSNSKGEELSQQFCSTCHLFPSPGLLDKDTWITGVLPDMGRRLGIRTVDYDPFRDLPNEEKKIILDLDIYPDSAHITQKQWESIIDYYTINAPDSLLPQSKTIFTDISPPPFQPNFVDIEGKEVPQVTLLHFDQKDKELYIGDNLNLYALNTKGNFSSSWALPSPAVEIKTGGDGKKYLLTIGHFKPSDLKLGTLFDLKNQSTDQNSLLLEGLNRPVSFTLGDLNGDLQEDVIVCGFGHHRGELVWYDHYETKNVLNAMPGARKAIVRDLNGDQRPDITVLMAQAWEGVDVYFNQGEGQFRRKRVLEFSPVQGVSFIEMSDFNGDGYQDLLLTNGDNWDYSVIKKPYHGIRIYLNNGKNEFQEKYFFPMYGCSKALARDFDQDGDLDIAAISFYDNIEDPDKSFVYLENTGELSYQAHYMEEAANGKWLTMEAGDFNQDGKTDLFLGSYFHNIGEWTKLISKGVTTFPEVLLLLNTNR